MTIGHRNANLADVGTLFSEGSATGLSEAQLLERFLDDGDEAAFEAILRSHGPMVLGVCRRRLADPSDVDDAFQATFLVLVERARTLRDRDVLGAWLHRVAHRVATRARTDARRRKAFEDRARGERPGVDPVGPAVAVEAAELRAVLDEELARLPDRYRTPLVLCDLEGRTHEQAAELIRSPVGTVKSRLSRARERLRERLNRRGLSAGVALAPFPDPIPDVPGALIASTARAAARLAAGRGATAGTVAALMESVTRSSPTMTMRKLVATALTAACVVSAARVHARPAANPQEPPAPAKGASGGLEGGEAKDGLMTLRGRCTDREDGTPVVGARIRLFRFQWWTGPIVEVAATTTDAEGRYAFSGLAPSRPKDTDDPQNYAVFAEADGRPIGAGGIWPAPFLRDVDIPMSRDRARLAGVVRDGRGRPVAGAVAAIWAFNGRPITSLLASETGPDGRFAIEGVASDQVDAVHVVHPGHPRASFKIEGLPKEVSLTLPDGCRVSGAVTDDATGRPAPGVLVTAERLGEFDETRSLTDDRGRFAMTLAEDRYTFTVRDANRVAVAIQDQDCPAGEDRELPPFRLTPGGFIAGRVLDAATRKPIAAIEDGTPVELGLIGPDRPLGKVISPHRAAVVDAEGRFTLRAAAGDNFPYFVNIQGDRMGWDTTKQPPVVVKEGETTNYDMVVTRRMTPDEEMNTARGAVAALPVEPAARVDLILDAFRRLGHTVDNTEYWSALMRELVAVGRPAVPRLCEELDRTVQDRAIRRLAFALRAIGDPRAVPALIRAIPRTLLPSSSDYGLIAHDPAIAAFMQQNDLDPKGPGGTYFDLGRPYREVASALRKLTSQDFADDELNGLYLSEAPGPQALQRRLFDRQARRWAAWWEEHGRELVDDPAYLSVNLKPEEAASPREPPAIKPGTRLGEGLIGMVLSPPNEGGGHVAFFYDLDTGFQPRWPDHVPRDEEKIDFEALAEWAKTNGVDLMCVTRKAPDGSPTYVLRTFGLGVRELGKSAVRNLDRSLQAGDLPPGREVGDLLAPFDEATKAPALDVNGAFLYTTAEGNRGLIEVTDRVVRTADLTGSAGSPPSGVGFHKGVRFNLKSIIPNPEP